MSDDILTRLRNYIPGENDDWVPQRIAEAADEIERLREAARMAIHRLDKAMTNDQRECKLWIELALSYLRPEEDLMP